MIKFQGKNFKSRASLSRYKKYILPKKHYCKSVSSKSKRVGKKRYIAYNNVTQTSKLVSSHAEGNRWLGNDMGYVDLK